jgi:hypothetical protein
MNTRPLLFVVSLSLALSWVACVDVGTSPGPIVSDVQEPAVELCLEAQQQTYRCREKPLEEVQICKEASVGEFLWDTVDFCDAGQGCFESPLNIYPACSPMFDCFDMVYNLISCDSASELLASQRVDCIIGVERLAIDTSYTDVYDCYYDQGCDREQDVTACTIAKCGTLLAECVNRDDSSVPPDDESFPGQSTLLEDDLELSEDASTESAPGDADSDTPDGLDEQPDEVTSPTEPEVPPGCPVGFIGCVSECMPQCVEGCASSEDGPLTDYSQGACRQACPLTCANDCEAQDPDMGKLEMLGIGNCVGSCLANQGLPLQVCLLQQCPDEVQACVQSSTTEENSCDEAFGCLLQGVSGVGSGTLLECNSITNAETLDSARELLVCVAQATAPTSTCEWPQGTDTWLEHVQADLECLRAACSAEFNACPVSYE